MTVKNKDRLDIILVSRGLISTRSKARDIVKRGGVRIGGSVVTKPGQIIAIDAEITLESDDSSYVSRAALKLLAALDAFEFSPENRYCLDVGASTGGFTQILLERGAKHVYAVDVGRGQLHAELRDDPRVSDLPSTDARTLSTETLQASINAITADVSFISLRKVLQTPMSLASQGTWLAALIKPQFELGPEAIGKGGIVKREEDRQMAVRSVYDWIDGQPGWQVVGTIPSPITGQGGNQETLLGAVYKPSSLST